MIFCFLFSCNLILHFAIKIALCFIGIFWTFLPVIIQKDIELKHIGEHSTNTRLSATLHHYTLYRLWHGCQLRINHHSNINSISCIELTKTQMARNEFFPKMLLLPCMVNQAKDNFSFITSSVNIQLLRTMANPSQMGRIYVRNLDSRNKDQIYRILKARHSITARQV